MHDMKDLNDLFRRADYSDLTGNEKASIAELCSDQASFQRVKSILQRSEKALTAKAPVQVQNSLENLFDVTYHAPHSQPVSPSTPGGIPNNIFKLPLFKMFAVAASLVVGIFLYVNLSGNQQDQPALAKKEDKVPQKRKNEGLNTLPKEDRVATIIKNENPIPPEASYFESYDPDMAMIVPLEKIVAEEANSEPIRDIDDWDKNAIVEDADPKSLTITDQVTTKNASYSWTYNSNDETKQRSKKNESLSEISVSSNKRKIDRKRINTGAMLKQIKTVF